MNILIVGGGLAGCLLSWFLARQGTHVTVVDRGEDSSSTRVSAGIMLPVTGRRLVKAHIADKLIPFAFETYRQIEKASGIHFLSQKNVMQIFSSDGNRNDWYARSTDLDLKGYTGDIFNPGEIHPSVSAPYGAITLHQSGSIDPLVFMRAIEHSLSGLVTFIRDEIGFNELTIDAHQIKWQDEKYSRIVFCQGHESVSNPYTGWIPFKPVKGEILDFNAPGLDDNYIICGSHYLLPVGNNNFRVGSTYDWNELDSIPSDKGRKTLIDAIGQLTRCAVTVTGHKAGIRPAIIDRRPVIGLHPEFKKVVIFNGLGTKGALQGPYYANQASHFILTGTSVDHDVDLNRFKSRFQVP